MTKGTTVVLDVNTMSIPYTKFTATSKEEKQCPHCLGENNERIRLKLYQLNFEEAIYCCPSPTCVYLLKEDNLNQFIIKRDSSLAFCQKEKFVAESPRYHKDTREMIVDNTRLFVEKRVVVIANPSNHLGGRKFDLDFHHNADILETNAYLANNYEENISEIQKDSFLDEKKNSRESKGILELSQEGVSNNQTEGDEVNLIGEKKEGSSCVEDEKVVDEHMKAQANKLQNSRTLNPGTETSISPDDCVIVSDIFQELSAREEDMDIESTGPLDRPPVNKFNIQWTNFCNSCWLDSIMMCLVNSSNLRRILNLNPSPTTHILRKLCHEYDNCQSIYISESHSDAVVSPIIKIASRLNFVRTELIRMLQTSISFNASEFQSPLEILPVLLKLSSVEKLVKLSILWEFECEGCGHKRARRSVTHIASFPHTSPDFHPLNAVFERKCFECVKGSGTMTMNMEKLPPVLIFHFRSGLAHSNFRVLDFGVQGVLYSVFAVIQYITKPFKHFLTWIKDVQTNRWLCCNDLDGPVCSWQAKQPKIPPQQIHMVMWERASTMNPQEAKEADVSTILNLEVSTHADGIPLEQFFAHELNETIVLPIDDSGSEKSVDSLPEAVSATDTGVHNVIDRLRIISTIPNEFIQDSKVTSSFRILDTRKKSEETISKSSADIKKITKPVSFLNQRRYTKANKNFTRQTKKQKFESFKPKKKFVILGYSAPSSPQPPPITQRRPKILKENDSTVYNADSMSENMELSGIMPLAFDISAEHSRENLNSAPALLKRSLMTPPPSLPSSNSNTPTLEVENNHNDVIVEEYNSMQNLQPNDINNDLFGDFDLDLFI